jgi:3'-5' exoribonuclease
MKKSVFIKGISLGQKLNSEPFALREFEEKISRQGKKYLNIKFADKTGEVRGKVWTENLKNCEEDLKVGDIVFVSGEVQEYNEKLQIMAEKLVKAKDFPLDEFLETTTRNRDLMIDDLNDAIENITNPSLQELAKKIFSGSNKDKLVNYPGGEYVHHGYVGGLLEHIWEMHRVSKGFAEIYPKIDDDLLLIGILTHDIGKIEEYEFTGTAIVRTKEGKLIGHLTQGVLLVEAIIKQIKGFPEELKLKVLHLIISHNGSKEAGSPVMPQTLEGLALFLLDKSSADMNMAIKQIERGADSASDFTDYNKWLKSSMYLG